MKRKTIKNKFGGRCAYCGCELHYAFHVDHVDPLFRGSDIKPDRAGNDDEKNLFPACPPCNIRKGTLTLEQFRDQIKRDAFQLERDSAKFRSLKRFNIISISNNNVKFYFENYKTITVG